MASKKRVRASTTVVSDTCVYTWTIKNYTLIKSKVGEKIESPRFSVGNDEKKYFNLELYPAGDRAEKTGSFIVGLIFKGTNSKSKPDKLICRATISVITDKKVAIQHTIHEEFERNSGWNANFHEVKNINKLISSKNTLTIECELEVFKQCFYNEIESYDESDAQKDENFDKARLNLSYPSEEFSDVKLSTSNGKTIKAHKIILASASPVFKAMFTHDMLENKNNTIKITDISHNILVELMRYIYTGQIEVNKTDMVLQLLAVAEKYQISHLKIKCEKVLCAVLSTEDAVEFLAYAHKYNAKHLEKAVLKFVNAHPRSLDSEQLNRISDPDVLIKITHSIRESITRRKH